jgi:hypothetical protein
MASNRYEHELSINKNIRHTDHKCIKHGKIYDIYSDPEILKIPAW